MNFDTNLCQKKITIITPNNNKNNTINNINIIIYLLLYFILLIVLFLLLNIYIINSIITLNKIRSLKLGSLGRPPFSLILLFDVIKLKKSNILV